MVFQLFLSRYLTDFDEKNTVCSSGHRILHFFQRGARASFTPPLPIEIEKTNKFK
jgi:hypothetical protein